MLREPSCSFILTVVGIINALFVSPAVARPYVELGPSDGLALDQPRVTIMVYDYDPGTGSATIFGPEFYNTFLLDTGANGILAVNGAVDEMVAGGYQTDGQYMEQGVAGFELMDVSKLYYIDYAGSAGAPVLTLPDVRLLSKSSLNFGSFSGIMGMSAMLDRITTLDMTVWSGGQIAFMDVAFPDQLPGDNGHRYSVALTLVEFEPTGQVNNDPLPTYAPLPFAQGEVRHGGNVVGGQYLLDTGAQVSIISLATALAAGLDENGNGSVDDEALYFLPFGGIGGQVEVPILAIDSFALLTEQGIDLVWTAAEVAVLDIEGIPGVLGMDFLTSGWLGALLGGPDGYIEQINLDFRDAANLRGTMLLDINPALDNVIGDPRAPAVVDVLVSSTGWTSSFLTGLGATGYSVAVGSGDQLLALPWIELDRIQVVFSEDVTVQQNDLSLRGVNVATYAFSGFSYDAGTFTATWTLADPIGPDKLSIALSDTVRDQTGNALDGEWTDGVSTYPSGDGTAGGDFSFRFNVLPGDANQDGSVFGNDVILTRNAQFTFPGDPGYSIFYDVDGSGSIFGNDVINVRNRQFTFLPSGEPLGPARGQGAQLPTVGIPPDIAVNVGIAKPDNAETEEFEEDITPLGCTLPAAVIMVGLWMAVLAITIPGFAKRRDE